MSLRPSSGRERFVNYKLGALYLFYIQGVFLDSERTFYGPKVVVNTTTPGVSLCPDQEDGLVGHVANRDLAEHL